MRRTTPVAILAVLSIGFICNEANGAADCSGPVDCGPAPQPLGLPPAQTHRLPFAFDVGPGVGCYSTTGRILAGVITELRSSGSIKLIQETALFTDAPSIEVVAGGAVNSFAVTGNVVRAAGAVCMPHLAESFMITDQVLAALAGGRLRQWAFPPGVFPRSAAGIGSCTRHNNYDIFTISIELSDNSIMAVAGGSVYVQVIPEPIMGIPDCWTSGQISGTLVFGYMNAYLISGGAMNTVPLQGLYISHVRRRGAVDVTTTSGQQTIRLAPGAIVMPYALCATPMMACGTPPTIAINVSPCPDIRAVAADWPIPAVTCFCQGGAGGGGGGGGGGRGGGGGCGKAGKNPGAAGDPEIADKEGTAEAYAFTTLAGGMRKRDKSIIWHGGTPGSPGTPAEADASVAARGDHASARAFISASYDATAKKLKIHKETNTDYGLIHPNGHIARVWAAAYDPITFINWRGSENLGIAMELLPGNVLPIHAGMGPQAESRVRYRAASDIPGYQLLYEAVATARHDGVSPFFVVNFTSHPALGLDDNAVGSALSSLLSYDDDAGAFRITNNADILSFEIDVPADGTYSISFSADTQGYLPEKAYVGPPPEWGGPPECNTPASDYDSDGDVDQSDFGFMQACITAPGGLGDGYDPGVCWCADYNRDDSVNMADLLVFEACSSGPSVPAEGGCEPEPPRAYLSMIAPSLTQYAVGGVGGPFDPPVFAWSVVNTGLLQAHWIIQEVDESGVPWDYPFLAIGPPLLLVPPEGVATAVANIDPMAPGIEEGANVAYIRFINLAQPEAVHIRAVVLLIE